MVDDVIRSFIDDHLNEDIEQFFLENSNGESIDTNQVYVAHCVFIDENNRSVNDERYSAVIDASVKTPHNRFFIDIINKQSLGISYGWTGFAMTPNSGWSVDNFEILNDQLLKEKVTFDELKTIIDQKNESLKSKKSK